ncbi:MAG: aminotransferase class V-fold PLP-dependent enzyme, partial [Clostridia bacterium]|nr:aminotransferase class V-fold PLP-dependent enzyme [Clostridia bacterium]
KRVHLITSTIEHHAILHTCQAMEDDGCRVSYLPVDEFGRVNPMDVASTVQDDTTLITVMAANNEIGTLEPVQEIGAIARETGVLFHTDAVQAIGAVPVDVNAWNVDMLSLSAHKFHGPKGIGALYIREGIRGRVSNLIFGGAQERGLRAGTENLPAIVGLGAAIELAEKELPWHRAKMTALRDQLIEGIIKAIPEVRLNGHPTLRLPGNVNVSIRYLEGEALLMRLDLLGIEGSSGSACTSGSLDPSHVLLGIGLSHEDAHGSLRLSLGRENTEAQVQKVLDTLPKVVANLRAMSPLSQNLTGTECKVEAPGSNY